MRPLSIVIVSYGSARYLPICFASLYENLAAYPAAQVVLVENKTDPLTLAETRQVVEAYLERGLQFLAAPVNLGYGGGANFGWKHLSASPDALEIVLNPDMRFPPGWLDRLLTPFESDPAIGIVGCKLLDGQGAIQHAGGLLRHGSFLGLHFGYGEPDDGRWDESGEVDFVTGAVLAIRADLNRQLGRFDEAFFPGYFEDVDLCWRARQQGYKVWYQAAAWAWHYEGGAFGRGLNYYSISHRNRWRFVLKNLTSRQLFSEFVPAERNRLRGTLDDRDRVASSQVYAAAVRSLFPALPGMASPIKEEYNNYMKKPDNNKVEILADDTEAARQSAALLTHVGEVQSRWLVEEKPFRSRLPGVARLRERFNSISTRWYVKPILAQQVEFNGAVARTLQDLAKLTTGSETANQMQAATLAARLLEVENRLERIERLLEKVLEK